MLDKSKFQKSVGSAANVANAPGAAPAPALSNGATPFAGLDPDNRYPLFPAGTHRVRIVSTSRKRGPTFVADCEIIESSDPSVPAGGKYSYVQSMKDEWGKGARKVMGFVCAVVGADAGGQAQMKEEAKTGVSIVDAACGAATAYGENPLAGAEVLVHASIGAEDGRGGNYRDCVFESVG